MDNPTDHEAFDVQARLWETKMEAKSTALYGPKDLRARKNQRYARWLVRRYTEPAIRGLLFALSRLERPLCAQMLSEHHDVFHDDLTAMIDPFEYGGRHFYVRAVEGNKYTVEISISLGRLGDGGTLTFERQPNGEFVHCEEDEQFML